MKPSKMKISSKVVVFLSLINPWVIGICQDSTSSTYKLKHLTEKIDSLERMINSLYLDSNKNFSYPPKDTSQKIDNDPEDLLQNLTKFISFEDEVQSSKRGRINELLNALRSAPGILNFKGDATTSIQWKSGPGQYSSAVASFDIFAFAQLGDNIKFFANIEAIGGNGPNNRINSYSVLNGDAGSTQSSSGLDLMHLLEAWAEFGFFDEWFNLTIGKLDLTNYYDINSAANDETLQFISGPFINSPAFPVPSNSAGVRVNANLANLIFFQFACASEDNSGDDIFSQLFKIVGTKLNVQISENFLGEYHIYGYKSGLTENATGYGISLSNTFGLLRLFGRWNQNNRNYAKIFQFKNFWSIGFDLDTKFIGENTLIGLAGGEIETYSKSLKKEFISEFYFRYQLNEWIYLSPHLQLVKNPSGNEGEILMIGARTHFNF